MWVDRAIRQYCIKWGYYGSLGSVYFCFYEIILSIKNPKMQNRRFSTSKKLVSLDFVLLVGFCLWRVFLRSKYFYIYIKKAWNYHDNLIYYTTCTGIWVTVKSLGCYCFHLVFLPFSLMLWTFLFIFVFVIHSFP